MTGLNLVPNEIVGWRIRTDWHNYTVVIVKRRKKDNAEYETPLGYCARLEHATRWLIDHVTRVKAEELQDHAAQVTESVASAEALAAAIEFAKNEAILAVAELDARLTAAGLITPKQVHQALVGGSEMDSSAELSPDVAD